MFEDSSIAQKQCRPMVAYSGRGANLLLTSENLSQFHHLKFSKIDAVYAYDVSICRFDSMLFSDNLELNYAFLIQTSVKSDDPNETDFRDANIFLENNFDDMIEYFIILPRMFKRHRRYVLDLERDKDCSFEDFTVKIELWKKAAGIR
jgi:hypothetical protein